jgi:hypothetical protein
MIFCLLEDSSSLLLVSSLSEVSHPAPKRRSNKKTFLQNSLQNIKMTKIFPARKKMMMSCVNTERE